MSKRLYELIKDKNVVLNDDFLNESFELLMREEDGLKDFINNFKIDYSISGFGSYSNEERIISINPVLIMTDKVSIDKKIQAIRVIRHEMEHARNLKTLYNKSNGIEAKVVSFSLIEYLKKHGLVDFTEDEAKFLRIKRFQNYEFDPGERIADIRAYKYIVNLLKNQRRTHDLLIARSLLYYSYIRGYNDNRYYLDAPTYTYLNNMGLFIEYYMLKRTVDKNDYSLETRALLGLPLTYEEKDNLLLKKVRLQRRG